MQTAQTPVLKDVVLVGAGHSHVGVLRMFGMNPMPGVRLTLDHPRRSTRPIPACCPGMIAGLYDFDDAHIDTGPLSRFAQARLYHDEVDRPRSGGQARHLPRPAAGALRPPVAQHRLDAERARRARRDRARHPGQADRRLPRPLRGSARRACSRARGRARIGVVGGGAGGVELLLSLHRRLTRDVAAAGFDPSGLAFTLITSSDELLPTFPARMRQRFAELLRERGIRVVAAARRWRCAQTPCSSRATARCARRDLLDDARRPGALACRDRPCSRSRRLHQGRARRCSRSPIPTCSPPATSRRSRVTHHPSPASTPCDPARRSPTICGASSRASASPPTSRSATRST